MGWQERNIIDLVPTRGQHFNGQAEWMIGILKKQMQKSFESKRYSQEEVYIYAPKGNCLDSEQ